MKTKIQLKILLLVCTLLFFVFQTKSFAGPSNFTWTGTTSTSWTTATNWTPNGVPSTSDTVTIVSGSYDVSLSGNITVKKFTITSGTVYLNDFTLTITTHATFTSGTITAGVGRLIVSSATSTTFSGTTFSVPTTITTNAVYLNGSTFNDSLTITKNGNSNDNSKGGNLYKKQFLLTNSAKGAFVLSDSFPDTYEKKLIIKNTNEGKVYLAHRASGTVFKDDVTFYGKNIYSNYYGTAEYQGNITLNCPAGNVYFGYGSGSSTLANSKRLQLGDSVFSAGKLHLMHFTKLGTDGEIYLALTGSAILTFESGTVINSTITTSSPTLYLHGARFNNLADLTVTGTSTASSEGGCYFAGDAKITNNSSGTNSFAIGNTVADTFATTSTITNTKGTLSMNNAVFVGNTILKNVETATNSDRFIVASTGNCVFQGNIQIQNSVSGFCFGKTSGTASLASGKTLSFVSGFTGNLTLKNFTQQGSTAQSFSFTSTGQKLFLGPGSTFNGNFDFTGQFIVLNGTTFNGTATINRYGAVPDTCAGGNVFNSTTIIKDSSNAAYSYLMAYTNADDYNGDVIFIQKGSGAILYPAYNKNSTFAGNITVNSNSAFQFGGNGGKVILDGTTNQNLSNLSSYPVTMKKLQINKTANSFTLNFPLTVSDSLILTQGRINTDTINLLSISNGGKLSGGSDNSYINGPMKKTGNSAFVFPLGSSSLTHPYHPLEITTPSSTTDAYTANYFSTSQTIGSAIDTSIDNLNACQYWKLNRNTGSSKVKVKLSWNNDSCETISPSNFRVTGWNGSMWKDLGNASTSGDSIQGTVQSLDSLNTISVVTLAFKKCSAFRVTQSHYNVQCKGGSDGSAFVQAKGGTAEYNFLWMGGLGANSFANNLSAGGHVFQISDSRGCTISDNVIITEPDSLIVTYISTSSRCGDSTGSIEINPLGGTGNFKFYWQFNKSSLNFLANIPSGQYSVLVSDSNGCRTREDVFIQDGDGPGLNILNQTNIDCYGRDTGFVEIEGADGNGPFNYKWINSNLDTFSTKYFFHSGIYPVQITNIYNCISFDTVVITQPDAFGVTFQVTNTPCGSSTGEIVATPYGGVNPYSYFWVNYTDTDSIISNLSPGLDTLYVTDANSCSITKKVEVLSSSGFIVTSEVISNVTCFPDSGGSARVSVTGGTAPFIYNWSPMGGNSDTALSLMPGNYNVSVIDANGCKQKSSLEISGNPKILANLYPQSPSNQWSSNGEIISFPTGGNAPYQYLWSDSSTSNLISNLPIGKYSVRITDLNGCQIIQSIDLVAGTVNCFSCNPIHQDCTPFYIGPSPCLTCTTPLNLNIEDFGADGSDNISDECAFEEAANYLSLSNPNVSKTLNIPSGIYYVGYQEESANPHWLKLGATVFCLEGINNLAISGDPLNPKPIIRLNECMRYGAFIENEATNSNDRFLSDFPGRLIHCIVNGNTVTTNDNISWMNVDDIIYDSDPNNVFLHGPSYTPIFMGTYIDQIISGTEFTIIDAPYFNGDFDLRVQTGCKVVPTVYSNIASVGQMFHFRECNNITINYLELDGNIDNVVIGGGYYNDGIQVDYDGIFTNACNNFTISEVDIHHFGHDGIWINYMSDISCPPGPQSNFFMNFNILNSTSRFNGRNALSWTGGRGLTVMGSDFSYSGQSRMISQPGAGMDIEYELSNNPNSEGYFENTTFRYNKNHGVICDANNGGVAHISRDYEFFNCTFIGSENGAAVWPNSRNFLFRGVCDFYGKVWNPFPVIAASNTDPIYFDNTKFQDCNFNEELNELDPNVPTQFSGWHYFSFTPEETEVLLGNRVVRTYCGSNGMNTGIGHQAMVDFYNSSRVELTRCNFYTNLTSKLLFLGLGVSLNSLNYNEMTDCFFESRGLNFVVPDANDECTCDPLISAIRNTNLFGINRCHYIFPVRPDPSGIIPNPCGVVPWNYMAYTDWTFVQGGGNFDQPDPLGFGVFWDAAASSSGLLCGKFIDLVDQNSAMPLYSTPCQDIPIGFPTECSQSQRPARLSKKSNESQGIISFPNPVKNDLFLQKLEIGSEYYISDLLGNLIIRGIVSSEQLHVDLSLLSPGVYLFSTSMSTPKKIIKQ